MPAHAEPFAGDVPDRVWIDIGAAINEVSTNVAVQGPSGLGGTVNFEDVLDLPGDKTTARMLGFVRISEKRRYIDFGYVDISRRGTRTLDRDVDWGDHTFHAGGDVTSHFGTQFMYAAFRYDFLHEDKIRISGSAGATFLRLVASLQAQGGLVTDVDGNPVATDFESKVSAVAPVPMVGLNLDWALTKRLVLRTYTRFFRLNLDKFNGGLSESGIRLNWYFIKNFGMGLGYDRTELTIKELKVDTNIVKAGYIVTGIGLYFDLAF